MFVHLWYKGRGAGGGSKDRILEKYRILDSRDMNQTFILLINCFDGEFHDIKRTFYIFLLHTWCCAIAVTSFSVFQSYRDDWLPIEFQNQYEWFLYKLQLMVKKLKRRTFLHWIWNKRQMSNWEVVIFKRPNGPTHFSYLNPAFKCSVSSIVY